MKKKTVMAAASVVLCGAVWAPQIMEMIGSQESLSDPDADAAAHEAEMERQGSGASGGAGRPAKTIVPSPAASSGASQATVESTTSSDPLVYAERVASELESFTGGVSDLSALVEELTRSATSERTASESVERPTPSSSIEAALTRVAPPPDPTAADRAFLAEWLPGQTLTGLLVSDARSLALMGHRIVRSGDRLAGGRVEVVSVERSGVSVRCGEVDGWIELPPFVATGRSSTSASSHESPMSPASATEASPTNDAESVEPMPSEEAGS